MVSNRVTGVHSHRRAIGTFPNRRAAEQALHELRDSGFPMDRVSVIAQNSERNQTIAGADVHDRADNKADDGAKVGALSGGALGGLTGLLVGIGALAIPGIGPIMLAGAAATALATTAAGTAIGAAAGGLLGGLIGLGIPEDRARVYSDRVSAGEYLVMVDGTDAEIARAAAILNRRGIEEWGVYDIPGAGATTAHQTAAAQTSTVAANPSVEANRSARINEVSRTATDAESVRLYEERLIVDKDREKTGEVTVGKRVEVQNTQVSVPIERERVVIERVPGNSVPVDGDANAFHDETLRVEVYEETPDIRKEVFVREEVSVRKEVDRETVQAEETLRREKLDVKEQGHPVIENHRDDIRPDQI